MKTLLLILMLLLCSCTNQETVWVVNTPPPVPTNRVREVYIDRFFSKVEQEEIIKAIQQWNWALNNQMTLKVVDLAFDMEPVKIEHALAYQGILILSVPSYGAVMRYVDDGNIGGKTDLIGGHTIYLLNDRINKDNIFAFSLHELGHVLGSEHTKAGLMYPRYRPSQTYCVDKDALEQVATFNGLDVRRMNYCETK